MKARKSLAARVYRRAADLVEPLLPRGLVTPAHYAARRATRRLEAEHDMLMSMVQPGKTAVDVGANIGIFTYAFLARGANVVAIEPQSSCAGFIDAFYKSGFPRSKRRGRLEVHVAALGAIAGTAMLSVPLKEGKVDHESASLSHDGGESVKIQVPIRRLDDFGLDNVHVIKMDVEGNEIPALEGANATIRRWKPAILVEIEQRHHTEPIAAVFSRIQEIIGRGYTMSFLRKDGQLHPLSEFNVESDQLSLADDPLSKRYVRNFFLLAK